MTGQAFGLNLDAPKAWCNLCQAEGKTFELDADQNWLELMQQHSALAHRDVQAELERTGSYEPVEVRG